MQSIWEEKSPRKIYSLIIVLKLIMEVIIGKVYFELVGLQKVTFQYGREETIIDYIVHCPQLLSISSQKISSTQVGCELGIRTSDFAK